MQTGPERKGIIAYKKKEDYKLQVIGNRERKGGEERDRDRDCFSILSYLI